MTDELKKILGNSVVSEANNVQVMGNFLTLNGRTKLLDKGDLIIKYKSGKIEYISKWER